MKKSDVKKKIMKSHNVKKSDYDFDITFLSIFTFSHTHHSLTHTHTTITHTRQYSDE